MEPGLRGPVLSEERHQPGVEVQVCNPITRKSLRPENQEFKVSFNYIETVRSEER